MDKPSSAALWREYTASPDTHRNIPNCSYAGYRRGEQPLPEPPVVADVRACGALGDGRGDDTAAFAAAIGKAREAGGGAIAVPAGRCRLDSILRLDRPGLVLRGEGPDQTTLVFKRPLSEMAAGWHNPEHSTWSYRGGYVWIGPEEDFGPSATAGGEDGSESPPLLRPVGEGWFGAGDQRLVTDSARRGDTVVPLAGAAAAGLLPGAAILLTWTNPADNSLFHFLAGHERMRDYPWESMGETAGRRWRWVAHVAGVEADAITLAQPLRVDIRPEWKVTVEALGPHVSESGVEQLTLEMPEHERQSHCRDLGYNGIYFSRAVNCWARDITVVNADSAINLSASKNVTVRDFVLRGQPCHHGATTRGSCHDNLFTDFRIESWPFHGLNVEGLSSGNVWRRGRMQHGTFDYHRGLSYENIKTDIEVANDSRFGGNDSAGPRIGARCVHWSLRVTCRGAMMTSMPGCPPFPKEPGEFVYQPDLISDGALVGVQGVPVCRKEARTPWGFLNMVPGDKNCIIADHGRVPSPPDLYEAQLELRTASD